MNAMTAETQSVTPREHKVSTTPRWRRAGVLLLVFLGAAGILYSASSYFLSRASAGGVRMLTTAVKKADLLVTVTEDGNVESGDNVELKCMVPGPITILEIVADGKHVKKGEMLVRLDSSSIEDSILTQEIAVAKAQAAKITAEKDFSAAKIAVAEYEQGTLRREVRRAEADIVIAKQNLSTAENQLFHTRKMHRKGFATELDLQSKEFALEEAKLDVEVAELTLEVLEKFTRAKTLEELISKRDSAEALLTSEVAAFTKESNQLKRLQNQLADCTITAPQDGMVVYANERSNPFQQAPKIDLGAQVNQFQAVLRLPDLKNIQVRTLVHETKVDQLRVGMRAQIKIQDRKLYGAITSIANQPEAANFFQGNVKEYATLVHVDGEPEDLKPGMTAEVEILVDERNGVLQVPVQCLIERGNRCYACVKSHDATELRALKLGKTNDEMMEILDGLEEGELVLLNPRTDGPAANVGAAEDDNLDANQRFGSSPARSDASTPARGGEQSNDRAAGDAVQEDSTKTASGATSNPPPGGGAAGRGSGAPGTSGFKWPTFKELDKDRDGKLSREESPSPWFDQIDKNSDGSLDPKEFKAAIDQAKKLMSSQGGGAAGRPAAAPVNQ